MVFAYAESYYLVIFSTQTWLQLLASFVLICSLGVTNFPVKLSKRPQREETTVVIVVHALRCGNPHFLLFQRPKKGNFLLPKSWGFAPAFTDQQLYNV